MRQYLEKEFSSRGKGGKTKLPTVRELSKYLNVSTATIYHVFKELAKEGRLETAGGRGSFLVGGEKKVSDRPPCIGLSWAVEVLGVNWAGSISNAVIQAAMRWQPGVNLRPIPMEVFHQNMAHEVLVQGVDEMDALVLFSSMKPFQEVNPQLVEVYERHRKPIVWIGAPRLNATENFVALDHFTAARLIGRVWAGAGRRRIAYLMRDSFNSTVSTLLTHIGLQSGVALGGVSDGSIQVIQAPNVDESSGYNAVKKVLSHHGAAPDAICCFGNLLALGAARALREAGLRVPEDVSIIGSAGSNPSDTFLPTLTRFSPPFAEVGRHVVQMIAERISRRGEPMPGVYIPLELMGGGSTTEQENEGFRAAGWMAE